MQILEHVYDFLTEFTGPANIIQGWQNCSTLPPNTEEYAVLTVIGISRQGTNVQRNADDLLAIKDLGSRVELLSNPDLHYPADVMQVADILGPKRRWDERGEISTAELMLINYDVQVDFCSQDYSNCMMRANRLATIARSSRAVEWFNNRYLSCRYADDPKVLPFASDTGLWESRYTVTLHLAGWTRVDIPEPAFTSVTINLENADVHHPVQE